MGAVHTSAIFNIGSDVISTAVEGKNGAITYRLGWLGSPDNPDGDPDTAIDAIYWGTPGVASRPAKADPDGDAAPGRSAQTLSINMAGENHVIAVRDLRTNRIFGQLKEGETCLYGASEGRVLIKKNGSVNIYTTKNGEVGGTGMGIFVNPDGSITIASHNGGGVQVDAEGHVRIFNKDGALQVTGDGLQVSSTSKVAVSAPSIVLGGAATQPVATLAEVSQLLTVITSLQTQITALQAAVTTIAAIPPLVALGAPAAASASAAAVVAGTVITTSMSAALPTSMMLKRVSAD